MKRKEHTYTEVKEKQNCIAQNIRKLRMEHHMNQETLGQKLHLLRQTISAYERGVTLPDIFTLMHIADLFQITLDELAGRDFPASVNIPDKNKTKEKPR